MGAEDGDRLGESDRVGRPVGTDVRDGVIDGLSLGSVEGTLLVVGSEDGLTLGARETDGPTEGTVLGANVGM